MIVWRGLQGVVEFEQELGPLVVPIEIDRGAGLQTSSGLDALAGRAGQPEALVDLRRGDPLGDQPGLDQAIDHGLSALRLAVDQEDAA